MTSSHDKLSFASLWLQSKAELCAKEGYLVEISATTLKVENPSITLDVDSGSHLGRITVWESGEWFMEVLSIQTEKTVVSSYGEEPNDGSLDTSFDSVFLPTLDSV